MGRWVVGPEPGRPECHPLAVRPPPLTLLSQRRDSVLPAPLPAAALGPHGGLTTEPAPWMPSGMLGIQLVLNACLMKESLATETQWTPQASVQVSGQCRLARCPLPHSSGPTESQKQLLFPFPPSLAPSGICEWGGRGVPSGDSSPQAGTAPWWSVSGTSGWASPVLLEPQALIQTHQPRGGPCPRRHPAGILSTGAGGCQRLLKGLQGMLWRPTHLPGALKGVQEPPLWGRVLGRPAVSCTHAKQRLLTCSRCSALGQLRREQPPF